MLDEINDIRAVDQHAHNVLREECELPFEAAFTEAADPEVWREDTPHCLFYRRGIKQLAVLYGCDPEPAAVKAAREKLDLAQRTRLCLKESRLKSLFLDDGMMADKLKPISWHQQFVPTHRLLRIEQLAQELLAQTDDFDDFEQRFTSTLQSPDQATVGLKSIAAYRGGLNVPISAREEARADFLTRERSARVARSPFYSFLFHRALEIAHDRKLPVQFHTGFGDPDLALELSNPLLMRPLLERYGCDFVMLHAGYPFAREAGFLCSVYRNAWVDFGLAIPLLSVSGMRSTLRQLMELTPLNKLLYSSDASLIPELYYLGSVNGRRVLAEVLEQAVKDGDLSRVEATRAAVWIMAENAERLYKLG